MSDTRTRLRDFVSRLIAPPPPEPEVSPTRTPAVERMLDGMRQAVGGSLATPVPPRPTMLPPAVPRPVRAGLESVVLPSDIVVLITSTFARRESLARVLHALAQQTLQPTRVLLRLDFGAGAQTCDGAAMEAWLTAAVPHDAFDSILDVWADEQPGAGRRWLHPGLTPLPSNALLFTLDDDIVPRPEYLETVARLCVYENAAITYHGWSERPEGWVRGMLHHKPDHDMRVCCIGAGVACYRWRWVRELAQHPLAWRMLRDGPASDDDALLALHLWTHGVYVLRPGGPPLVVETEASRDASASHKVHGLYRHGQRLGLAITHDAPLIVQEFPGPVGTERGLNTTLRTTSSVPFELVRQRIHRAARAHTRGRTYGAPPPFFEQLEPHLLALGPGASIVAWGVGRHVRWLALYAAALYLDFTVCAASPELTEAADQVIGFDWAAPATLYYAERAAINDIVLTTASLIVVAPNQLGSLPEGVSRDRVACVFIP